ncbi:phosphate signaling complex protein PhoU [Natronobacterium gregoryi]|uniref:Phosphate-specific transport system accessory protein PhoU n=2 Tax=Natronobacterium gregoryi TaxID=44930 RepID=L0ALK7_NATGS|nr:phosphate signaling complex protein PhoU [Natronobacterium gregoryi]AFZ73940.1 phosphate transport system regulatory protein PhoU [Natronobacterium gregoryi SP2]ELY71724.1 phosphate uptake regulator PhoU [Natronobacterium gregoryi SP2]PLK19520.1 phosphate transport system regulatory protein PhoU [Natronobacterium gregoryi SP2]SFJ46977.1 phosphate uptake regulator, PhoU [Natronobacterium gregoryi]
MSRDTYQEQLYELQEDVLEMSDVVCQRFRRALEAYETGDEALAESVIEGDHEINQLYLDLEGDCVELLALQQPVASDLRFVASSFKIITDLERVGDLAVNLAAYATQSGRERYPEVDVVHIGTETILLLEAAMQAYATDDAAATHEIAATDDEIDVLCERASRTVVRELLAADPSDEQLLEDVSRMLLTIRDLERVGDHAVNVAARTLYMVDNDETLLY